jgi:hypothetical protein
MACRPIVGDRLYSEARVWTVIKVTHSFRIKNDIDVPFIFVDVEPADQ